MEPASEGRSRIRWELVLALLMATVPGLPADERNIDEGVIIARSAYVDQPYLAKLANGSWLCVLTVADGLEGHATQHIVSTLSVDEGKTWTPLQDIEPVGPPESGWAIPLVVPGGRVYVFYNLNARNIRNLPGIGGDKSHLFNMLGPYYMKHSDDGGRTWSQERIEIPVKASKIDLSNALNGKTKFHWSVCYPQIVGDQVFIALAKIGEMRSEYGLRSEVHFLRASVGTAWNDPVQWNWDTLPANGEGLRSPLRSAIAEEPTLVTDTQKRLHVFFRTTDGHLGTSSSTDLGNTWSPTRYAAYLDGSLIKHPRAFCPVVQVAPGRYLLWYHNNDERSFTGRNPVWVAAGTEQKGEIRFGQPEILLYSPRQGEGMSYPSWLAEGGRLWVTETEKRTARLHEVERVLLSALWPDVYGPLPQGVPILEFQVPVPGRTGTPLIQSAQWDPAAAQRGFTLEFGLAASWGAGTGTLCSNQAVPTAPGVTVTLLDNHRIGVSIGDGKKRVEWSSDDGAVVPGKSRRIAITYDVRARVMTFLVDGKLLDGDTERARGWLPVPPDFNWSPGSGEFSVSPAGQGLLTSVRIYDRPLLNAQITSDSAHARR